MQRIAREVGLTTMGLYRYFTSKAEVVALMIDSVADSSVHFGRPSLPWSIRLKKWAEGCLTIYRDHGWFLEATTARQSRMGPNELAWMEAALAMLAESGLESKKRHHAFFTIIGHIRGHATFEHAGRSSAAGKEWTRELTQTLQQEPNRYPTLLEVLRSGAFSESITGAFDFGLDCILDGVRAQVSKADGTV
jgi:AcrR family transcriptional regulator